jgi:hypothetical protein
VAGLAGAVSRCDDERRKRALARRDVDVGRHPVAGDALIGDVLDPEAVVVDGGETFRGDRPGRRPRNAADEIDDSLSHVALASLRVVIAAIFATRSSSCAKPIALRLAISLACAADDCAAASPGREQRPPGLLAHGRTSSRRKQPARARRG